VCNKDLNQHDVIKQVRQIVDERVEPSDPAYETAVTMVAALFVGPNVDAIVGLTGSTKDLVENIASRMRGSVLWTDEGVDYYDWFSDDLRGFAGFGINLGIAIGIFIRTSKKTSTGEWLYQAVLPNNPALLARIARVE
jgi:hypothetical protein